MLASGSLLKARLQSTDVLDMLGFYSCSCVAGTVGAVKEGECQVDCGLKLTIDGGHAWVGKCYSSCLDAHHSGAREMGFAYKLPDCWTWCEAIPALLLADEENELSQALGEGTHHVSVTLSNRNGQVLTCNPRAGSRVPPFCLCGSRRNHHACALTGRHTTRVNTCVSLYARPRAYGCKFKQVLLGFWFLSLIDHLPLVRSHRSSRTCRRAI